MPPHAAHPATVPAEYTRRLAIYRSLREGEELGARPKPVQEYSAAEGECWGLERMTTDSYMRAVDIDAVTGSTVPGGRHVEGGEVRALFEHLAPDPARSRAAPTPICGRWTSSGARTVWIK